MRLHSRDGKSITERFKENMFGITLRGASANTGSPHIGTGARYLDTCNCVYRDSAATAEAPSRLRLIEDCVWSCIHILSSVPSCVSFDSAAVSKLSSTKVSLAPWRLAPTHAHHNCIHRNQAIGYLPSKTITDRFAGGQKSPQCGPFIYEQTTNYSAAIQTNCRKDRTRL